MPRRKRDPTKPVYDFSRFKVTRIYNEKPLEPTKDYFFMQILKEAAEKVAKEEQIEGKKAA